MQTKKDAQSETCCQVQSPPGPARAEKACSTEACTVSQDQTDPALCPVSGTAGHKVQLITLKALLNSSALQRLDGRAYRYCPAQNCDVVYFDNAAGSVFRKGDLTIRVGQKDNEEPIPFCYCFDITLGDLRNDIASHGRSTIASFVKGQVQAGHCACEVKNPRGTCCLGEIVKAVKDLE